MEMHRFDCLAKALATSTTRRTTIRALLGLAGGAFAAGSRPRGADADRCADAEYGQRCRSNDDCCSDNCVGGSCACRPLHTRCSHRCVNLRSDETNCGACGVTCDPFVSCRDGACACSPFGRACQADASCCSKQCIAGQCACGVGRTRCGTACINTQTDAANCGGCGQVCPGLATCRGGECACDATCTAPQQVDSDRCVCVCPPTGCPDGQSVDPETCACVDAPTEVITCGDMQTDAANCGACGQACTSGEACCGGTCTSLKADRRNCGACGKHCRNGSRCRKGRCRRRH